MQRKVNIVTLGCSKNLVDSEHVLGALRLHGFDVVHDGDIAAAPIAVINTCGFILDAKEESISTILNFIEAKQRGIVKEVFVMGCLTERYEEELTKEFVEVDGIFGARDISQVIGRIAGDERSKLIGERVLATPPHYAYFKISEGCSRQCSFCAIPGIRGPHRSREHKDLLDEAGKLAAGGVKELIMIAQDLTYYGLDIYGKRTLPALVEDLAAIDELKWIRLHYTYPERFPMELLDVMRRHSNVCRYIDIPIQHTSERILRSMQRGGDEESLRRLLGTMRDQVPGVALRTTLITGYPGETDEEFNRLLAFMKELRFERLGVFTYSHEEHTPAYQLRDDVPADVKTARMEEIMHVQQSISHEHNKGMIGSEIDVIVDRVEDNILYARSEFDSPEVDNEVIVDHAGNTVPGQIIRVQVQDATEFDLYATPL